MYDGYLGGNVFPQYILRLLLPAQITNISIVVTTETGKTTIDIEATWSKVKGLVTVNMFRP